MRRSLVLCLALLVVLVLSTACGSDPETGSAAAEELDVGVPFDDDIPFTAFFRDEIRGARSDASETPDEVAGVTVERDERQGSDEVAEDLGDDTVIRVPLQDRLEALGEVLPPSMIPDDELAAEIAADLAPPTAETFGRTRGQRDLSGPAPIEEVSPLGPRGNRSAPTGRAGTP